MTRVGSLDDIAEILEATGQDRCLRRVPAFVKRPYAGYLGAVYPASWASKPTVMVIDAFHRYRPMPVNAAARVPEPVPSDDDE